MLDDLVVTLAVLVPFMLTGMLVERLHAAERRGPDYARNVRLNLCCTVLYFAGDVVAGAWFAFSLASVIRALPGAGLLALSTFGRTPVLDVVVGTILWLAANDLLCYWWHRLQHTSAWLWAQHEVHHADEHLNVTSAYRHHWLEAPLKTVAVVAPVTYLFVPTPVISATVYLAGLGLTFFAHMDVRIGFGRFNWVLLTPQMHRIHHSREPQHHDRNLAFVFPIWDVLFGTYYRPGPTEYPATGLASGEQIRTVWQASTWPFRRWIRKASRTPKRKHWGLRAAQSFKRSDEVEASGVT